MAHPNALRMLAAMGNSMKEREKRGEGEQTLQQLPPPSPAFLRRTRRSGHPGVEDEAMLDVYDEMRQMLSHITAEGNALPDGKTWQGETSGMHVRLACEHLRRFFVQLCCGAETRLDPDYKVSTSGFARDDGELKHDEDGVPDVEQLARRGLILPITDSWKEKWDMLILMMILYSAAFVPLRVCFAAEAEGVMWYVEVTVTLFFILDMYFTFNTVYFDLTSGEWVVDRRRIAGNYLKSWFWIDAPSSVPVELIDVALQGESNDTLGLLQLLRLFRLLRLLRLLKIEGYVDMIEEHYDVNLRSLRIFFMLLKISFLAHFLGCFWFGIHVLSGHIDPTNEQPTWATEYDNGRAADDDTPLEIRYLYSVYWSVTTLTTVGYGDVVPQNTFERLYALGTMLLSAIVFGYLISNIGALVASADRQAAKKEANLDMVRDYVKFRRLPYDMATRVRKHYSFYYTQRSSFNEVELLDGLPPSLGSEVTRYVLKDTLGRIPLFQGQWLDPEFQSDLFPLIKPVSYQPGEVILKRGEPSLELLFLLSGEVSVLSAYTINRVCSRLTPTEEIIFSNEPTPQKVMALKHMGAFGATVLTGRRCTATHLANTSVHVHMLSNTDIAFIFKKNPRMCRRVKTVLLAEVARKERMLIIFMRFLISSLRVTREDGSADLKVLAQRSSLIIQKAWKRFSLEMQSWDIEDDDGRSMLNPNIRQQALRRQARSRRASTCKSGAPASAPASETASAPTSAPVRLPGNGSPAGGDAIWLETRGKVKGKKLRLAAQTEAAIADVFADLKSKFVS